MHTNERLSLLNSTNLIENKIVCAVDCIWDPMVNYSILFGVYRGIWTKIREARKPVFGRFDGCANEIGHLKCSSSTRIPINSFNWRNAKCTCARVSVHTYWLCDIAMNRYEAQRTLCRSDIIVVADTFYPYKVLLVALYPAFFISNFFPYIYHLIFFSELLRRNEIKRIQYQTIDFF